MSWWLVLFLFFSVVSDVNSTFPSCTKSRWFLNCGFQDPCVVDSRGGSRGKSSVLLIRTWPQNDKVRQRLCKCDTLILNSPTKFDLSKRIGWRNSEDKLFCCLVCSLLCFFFPIRLVSALAWQNYLLFVTCWSKPTANRLPFSSDILDQQ